MSADADSDPRAVPAEVMFHIIPDHHERPAELLVGGIQEPRVIRLGAALAPILADGRV